MSLSKPSSSDKILYRVYHFYNVDYKIYKYRVVTEKERSIEVERIHDGAKDIIFTGPNPINAISSGWWETEDGARKHVASMARDKIQKNKEESERLTPITRFSSEDIEVI
jgi:hypothetical protein